VIVVIGAVEASATAGNGSSATPSGLASGIALAAAAVGARVEVVTRLGEDAAGDDLLLAFAGAKVGHVATLRDAAHATLVVARADDPIDPDAADDLDPIDGDGPAIGQTSIGATGPSGARPTLEAADVALALRYLSDYRVIVVVHPAEEGIVHEVVAASDWASAHLVVVTPVGAPTPDGLPDGTVLLAAEADADSVATLIGRYAAAVDGGDEPAIAFQSTLGAIG